MTIKAIAGVGLRDGSQYTLVTCACGAQFAARGYAAAVASHASHAPSCDWQPPATPLAATIAGTSSVGVALTPAEIAGAIGVTVGQLSTVDNGQGAP